MSRTLPRLKNSAIPNAYDDALWASMTPEEREAELKASLDEAEAGGLAPERSVWEIVRAARRERGGA